MVWQADEPKRPGAFPAGVGIGMVAAILIVLALPSGSGFVLVVLWLVTIGITFGRRPAAGFGLLVGSLVGSLFWGALLLPLMLGDRIDEDRDISAFVEPTQARTIAAVQRVLDNPKVLPDDGFWINNRTMRQVEVDPSPEVASVTVEPNELHSVDLAGECASVTITDTISPEVGTRQEICLGEYWQIVPYVPEPDEVKPGEAMPPAEWFDGKLRVAYEPAEPIRISAERFMIANTRDVPVTIHTRDGWELARIKPGEAAAVSVSSCVDESFLVAGPEVGSPDDELQTMCDGNGWLLTDEGALEIHGSRY